MAGAMFNTATGGGGLFTAAASLLVLLLSSSGAAEQASPMLTVAEKHGVYTVVARFHVEQTAPVVLEVLTDYEQIPRFMPDVRSSIVRDRGVGRAVVEQELVSGVMLFSKRVHLVLDIEEQPDALLFRDRCRSSFTRYEGAWHLTPQDGRTDVTYELTAAPAFDVPGFMLKRLLRRDSSQMIERLRREIDARAGAPIAAGR